MALEFQEVAVAEQFAIPSGGADGGVIAPVGQQARHLGGWAAGQTDQAGAVLLQQRLVDAGAVVKSLDVGFGDQLHQVAVSGVIAGQQHQVGGAAFRRVFVVPAVVGDVNFAADDRLDAFLAAGGIEVDHAVKSAVVGNGERIHAQGPGMGNEFLDPADAVKHTVFGMDVKVCERQNGVRLQLRMRPPAPGCRGGGNLIIGGGIAVAVNHFLRQLLDIGRSFRIGYNMT